LLPAWLVICFGRKRAASPSTTLCLSRKRRLPLVPTTGLISTMTPSLVDVFSTPDVTLNFTDTRRKLLIYYSLLQSTNLTNSVLSTLPLPKTLDPSKRTPLTLRLRTLFALLQDTFACLIYLPFFFLPLLVHLPVYFLARLGASLVVDEEETLAQNKVVLGLLAGLLVYPATFMFLWALLFFSPVGALVAAGSLYWFAVYHNRLVDRESATVLPILHSHSISATYIRVKRVTAAWRVLLGVWTPRRFDLPLAALAQYTTPLTPATNPWIERPEPTPSESTSPAVTPALEAPPKLGTPASAERVRAHRAPTRRVIRHVLRARSDAVRALSAFMALLDAPGAQQRWVRASPHLALAHGGRVEDLKPSEQDSESGVPRADKQGWRTAAEVVRYLSSKGAKIQTLDRPIESDHWASVETGAEDSEVEDARKR
jgi:glycerol-3-phosphate O-acyltransferase/dihydroxyacetone phosphate acyltransferase